MIMMCSCLEETCVQAYLDDKKEVGVAEMGGGGGRGDSEPSTEVIST